MHFEILIEDVSGKLALESIVKKILTPNNQDHTYRIHAYKGIGRLPKSHRGTSDLKKQMLLNNLPKILKGYGKSLQYSQAAVIIVVDLDDKDCRVMSNST